MLVLSACKSPLERRQQALIVGEMLGIPLKTSSGSDDEINTFIEQLEDQTRDMVDTYVKDVAVLGSSERSGLPVTSHN